MTQPKVPAAEHTLRILSLLAGARGPLPASIIATKLELPRSTVYHLLSAMQQHGFVMHLPEQRRYGLGVAAFELSSAYSRQEPLSLIGRPLIAALVNRLGYSGHLAVMHGRDVLYIVEERAPGAPALVSDVNVRLPAHLPASGRAILAAMPKAQVRALFPNKDAFVHRHDSLALRGGSGSDSGSEPHGGSSSGERGSSEPEIDRYSALRRVLDASQTRGYALERGSVTPGFSSVAVPVLDHREWPVAAIAVTFRDEDVAEDQLPALVSEVRDTAHTLSTRIHGKRPPAAE
ncbi:MAG: IclR family transcriptional regulator [Leucobacter sp.]|nr:IclR family transcriptional regulator [Leucobacter sp.]